jgi:hypothetical protein
MEHEVRNSKVSTGTSASQQQPSYLPNTAAEYQYMCKYLGKHAETDSLQDVLKTLPVEQGLAAEASIDYYESLRMVRILEHTKDDP